MDNYPTLILESIPLPEYEKSKHDQTINKPARLQTKRILVTLDESDYYMLSEAARRRGLKSATLARSLLHSQVRKI